MQKDIIYIDVEDDITEIITKIKSGKQKIVALVPPKRVGVLQSAVNLRLLNRSAEHAHKRLVLITSNASLVALAANIGIPVAKTLQSKPELPEVSALSIDEGDDIIDGNDLPVGDHAGMPKTRAEDDAVEDAIETIRIDDHSIDVSDAETDNEKESKPAVSAVKVPNFARFRKKLFLGIGLGVIAIIALVWAFVFAPSARIIVSTKTSTLTVSAGVTLGGNQETNVEKGIIKSTTQTLEKEQKVQFTPSGQKDFGTKATGTLRVSKLSESSQAVPAGSRFTAAGGLIFVTQEAVTIPASQPCFPSFCAQAVDVAVTAENGGTNYNGISGSATGASGVSGIFQGQTSGGTSQVNKTPTADDIKTATAKLATDSSDSAKTELLAKLSDNDIVVSESFTVVSDDPVATPKVGEESKDSTAYLSAKTTYTITVVAKQDVEQFLRADIDKQLAGKDNQRAYSTGISDAKLTSYMKDGDTQTAKIVATAQIGPSIDESKVKAAVKGKIFGEAQSSLESISGVTNVDIRFSFFWVRTVPGDDSKITVEFTSENDN